MTDRELLELIASQVSTLTEDVAELKDGQARIEDKIDDIESKNANNHVLINSKLIKISEDLDFLTHKEFQTEKEMYHIKKKLSDRKRNIK